MTLSLSLQYPPSPQQTLLPSPQTPGVQSAPPDFPNLMHPPRPLPTMISKQVQVSPFVLSSHDNHGVLLCAVDHYN